MKLIGILVLTFTVIGVAILSQWREPTKKETSPEMAIENGQVLLQKISELKVLGLLKQKYNTEKDQIILYNLAVTSVDSKNEFLRSRPSIMAMDFAGRKFQESLLCAGVLYQEDGIQMLREASGLIPDEGSEWQELLFQIRREGELETRTVQEITDDCINKFIKI